MIELKIDLNRATLQKNKKKLVCLGCRIRTDELFSLPVENGIVLMCEDCRESLIALLDKEDEKQHELIINNTLNKGIAVNKNGLDVSKTCDFGFYDRVKYLDDHTDC